MRRRSRGTIHSLIMQWTHRWLLAGAIFAVGLAAPCAASAASTEGLQITSPVASLFDEALGHYHKSEWKEALTGFAALVRDFPTTARAEEACFRIAECYQALGQSADAIKASRFALERYPDSVFAGRARLQLAEILIAQKRPAEAAALLEKVEAKAEAALRPAIAWTRARAQMASEDGAQQAAGRAALEQLAAAEPPTSVTAGAAAELAQACEQQNQNEAALKWWQRAVATAQEPAAQVFAAARGGWTAVALESWEKAESLFEKVRQLTQNTAADVKVRVWRKAANSGLVRVWLRRDQPKRLLELLQTEKEEFLESSGRERLYAEAYAYYALRQWDAAAAAFDRFLAANPPREQAALAAYQRLQASAQLDPRAVDRSTEEYLQRYPDARWADSTRLLRAQELSRQSKWSEALPLWQSLARRLEYPADPAAPAISAETVLQEFARTRQELGQWKEAATVWGQLSEAASTKNNAPLALQARVREAGALEKSEQIPEALTSWKMVQQLAPAASSERRSALEQIGLLLLLRQNKTAPAAETFELLLREFPDTSVRALASYTIGAAAIEAKDDAKAVTALENARRWDASAWQLPATEALARLAFAARRLEDATRYAFEYETTRQARGTSAKPLPAALWFWLARQWQERHDWEKAARFFTIVTQDPEAEAGAAIDRSPLRPTAWWGLAQAQREQGQWKAAIEAYAEYQRLTPESANHPEVLLELAAAHTGNRDWAAARAIIDRVLITQPEGKFNAQARRQLGELLFAQGEYAAAGKAFSALALLYDDSKLTPDALEKAARAYEKAGDVAGATESRRQLEAWRQKNATTVKNQP